MDDINKQNQAKNEATNNKTKNNSYTDYDFGNTSIFSDSIDELIKKIKEETEAVDEILSNKPKIEIPVDQNSSFDNNAIGNIDIEMPDFDVPDVEPILEELKKEHHPEIIKFEIPTPTVFEEPTNNNVNGSSIQIEKPMDLVEDTLDDFKIDQPILIKEENKQEIQEEDKYVEDANDPFEIEKQKILDEHKKTDLEQANVKKEETIEEKNKQKAQETKKDSEQNKKAIVKKNKTKIKKPSIKIKPIKINLFNKEKAIKSNNGGSSDRPKAKKATLVWAIIVSIVLFFFVAGVIGAGVFATILCKDKPTLNVTDLVSPDSSTIYDSQGNKIMEVGMYLRENIEYDELPNCVVDAFLASEDSRFYEHLGFDIPRFTKALMSYVAQGGEISSGGSTLTMQLIKNSYFSIDADDQSTIAAREGMSGIKRKMQEIILSLELTLSGKTTKQDTFAMFVNKVNYGNNIRGIEKAAQYYFGKSAKELNVGESAFLAGVINLPNVYNPYNELDKYDSIYLDPDSDYVANATSRRNEVLNLMVQHGYITESEAELYKSIRIEDMLCGVTNRFTETNDKYQCYIDAVIDEVEEMTGESPYLIGMNIYTNMNPYMQELMYDIQNDEDLIEFPNELCQSAIVLMDNQTGAIEALGGGRGEREGARQFNRATSAYLNPGSSMKPVVDYSLALEYLGWSTAHTITDQPYYLYDGPALISNFDHIYHGDMMMTEALARSQNTPAVQTLKAVSDKIGEDKVVDYLNSIGFKFEYADFDLQFAIGGNRCLATPVQMAGAHAIFMNKGKYIKPHTINYIEYVDGRDNYVADTVGTQVLSEATAWMTAYLENYNMEGPYSSLMQYCLRDYPLYGKTGTTDWGTSGSEFGIPDYSTKDSWLVMQTNRYTISCWTGYDELQKGAYFTTYEYQMNTKSHIVDLILDELETHASYEGYDPTIPMQMPDSVKEISFQKGTFPYVTSNPEVKGYIWDKWVDENTGSLEQALAYSQSIKKYVDAGISGIMGTYNGNQVNVIFTLSQGTGGMLSGENVDLSSSNVYNETTGASGPVWFPHWETIYLGSAVPPYYYNVYVNDVLVSTGATDSTSFNVAAPGGTKCKVEMWTTNPEHPMSVEIPIS